MPIESIDLKRPDWIRALTTGIAGVGFIVNDDIDLAFLSNEEEWAKQDKDHTYGFWILKNGKRDVAAETTLLRAKKGLVIQAQPFGPGELLTITRDNIEDLLNQTKKTFRPKAVSRRESIAKKTETNGQVAKRKDRSV